MVNKTLGFLKKADDDCKNIDDITELSFTILSTPTNIMDGCVKKLESKQSNNNYGTIKETALATLALNHAGKETELLEKWLIEQKRNPTDLIWFLQQDSDSAVGCNIEDDTLRYDIQIDENKKIGSDAGNCLKRAQSNFWFQINPTCYSQTFKISCDQDFITSLLYKSSRGSTIYVLENTQESPAFGTTEHGINSKCLGIGNSCDYEGTAWGALALQNTNNDIGEYIPYLIATADLKESFLPDAFIFLLTSYDDYGTNLIRDQRFGSYWEAPQSAYNRYYDTALTLLSLGTNQEQTIAAEKWLLFEQSINGCWGNSVRETAFILWALEQRDYLIRTNTVYCTDAEFFCTARSDCSPSNDLGNSENYYCSGLSNTCCKEDVELVSCNEMPGVICPSNKVCDSLTTTDKFGEACCLSSCTDPVIQTTECEDQYLSCYSECGAGLEEAPYSCGLGQSCCSVSDVEESTGLPWWVWVLIILIIVVLVAIGIMYKRKKDKEKAEKSSQSVSSGMIPPGRPGMHRRPGMHGRRPGPHRRSRPGGMRRPGPPGRRPGPPGRP